jgi:CxxC-x17-CxxC domain-containing protein
VNDKTLTCKECRAEFIFGVREQKFYAQKGFENDPQRCRDCRTARKNARVLSAAARTMYETICARCDVATTVPFKPRGDRPVYCRECFTSLPPAVAT